MRNNSTNADIKPTITNVNPNAPHKDIEFETIGNDIEMFAIGFHGKPVNIHSRNHKTIVQIAPKKNGRAAGRTCTHRKIANGRPNISAPAHPNPIIPGTVQMAYCAAISGAT